MHPNGPPRKFFRPQEGSRFPNPGTQQDFTVDSDTPPGAFHQPPPSSQSYIPPHRRALIEGSPRGFPRGPPGMRPHFNPYPPAHYGHYPRPPQFGYPPPQQWGRGCYRGQGGWKGRGRGRYGGGGGFRGRGGRYSGSRQRDERGSGQGGEGVDAYYSSSMFEDPWKDLLPVSDQSETITTPTSLDDAASSDMATRDDATTTTTSNVEQGVTTTELQSNSDTSGKDDIKCSLPDGQFEQSCVDNSSSADDHSGSRSVSDASPDVMLVAETNSSSPSCIEGNNLSKTNGSDGTTNYEPEGGRDNTNSISDANQT